MRFVACTIAQVLCAIQLRRIARLLLIALRVRGSVTEKGLFKAVWHSLSGGLSGSAGAGAGAGGAANAFR
uniref:Putative secreted protein n=1 Tax=Anopheles darlingi TaxID=43151 RepID=A0A2M4DIP5_ANODA